MSNNTVTHPPKKYAVTGANGLIGRHLCVTLAQQGMHVVAICRSSIPVSFMDYDNIELARGDIRDMEFLLRTFSGCDGVFHMAAFAKPWAKDPQVYFDINEHGTERVCAAAQKAGVRRVVYTASAGIHGPQQGALVDENTWPQQYHTHYEQSKFNGMQRAFEFCQHGLEVVVVSPARVYAPDEITDSNVPARMMRMYLQKGVGIVPASGKGIGSYVAMHNIVNGHLLAMQLGKNGEEYLLGGENLSYLEFFEVIKSVSGLSRPIIRVPYVLSLMIGKVSLFMANYFGITPTITTPWVRRYLKDWGIDSAKIKALGYTITPLAEGAEAVIRSWKQEA